jgi:hypothetical protein
MLWAAAARGCPPPDLLFFLGYAVNFLPEAILLPGAWLRPWLHFFDETYFSLLAIFDPASLLRINVRAAIPSGLSRAVLLCVSL